MFFTTSWDDGNKMDLKVAKLLNELNLKGTFYIPINWKFKSLSDSGIKKISKDFEIGSHSFSHRRMTFLNGETLRFEVEESKRILEKTIGKKINAFAYPFGSHSNKTAVAVENAGYRYARTVKEGNFSKPNNPFCSSISLGITNTSISPLKIVKRMTSHNSFWFFKTLKKIVDNAGKNSIIHISGHSWEFSTNESFEKLSDMLEYVSKKNVKPIANSNILKL